MNTSSCVVIFDRFFGPMAGDLDRLTSAIAAALARSCDVVTLCSDGMVQGERPPRSAWGVAGRVRETIAYVDPDTVVYVPQPGPTLPLFARAGTVVGAAPLAAHFMIVPCPLQRTWLGATLPWLYRGRILVGSFRSLLALSKLSLDAQIMPTGVDLHDYRPPKPDEASAARARHGIARNTFVFLLTHPGPRWQDAAALLAEINPSVIVFVPGIRDANVAGDRVRALAASDLDRECYWLADCLVAVDPPAHPVFEAPMAVIEALACGVPVLSTRENSWRDFLRAGDDVRFFSSAHELRAQAEASLMGHRDPVRSIDGFAWHQVVGVSFGRSDPVAHGGGGNEITGISMRVAAGD